MGREVGRNAGGERSRLEEWDLSNIYYINIIYFNILDVHITSNIKPLDMF